MAYRGYWIGHTLTGEWFIQKDGQHISYAADPMEARSIIDSLLD